MHYLLYVLFTVRIIYCIAYCMMCPCAVLVHEAFRAGQAQDLTKVTRAIRESKVESMEAVVEAIQRAKLEDLSGKTHKTHK